MEKLYPLKMTRYLSERLWGGKLLENYLKLDAPFQGNEPLGESWQVYANNTITNGSLAGQSLAAVAQHYGEALLGTLSPQRYGTQVPLLAKFIDAGDKLSIQVHPDDAYAQRVEAHTGHLGKTEAWYILDAKEDAHVLWGFNKELSLEAFRAAIAEGTLEDHVNSVPVKKGDVIFNDAGTLHAIGAGILLFEIQQSSDLTYRVYDFMRRGNDGKLRDLHIDKALDVTKRQAGEHAKIAPQTLSDTKTLLVSCAAFAMEAWALKGTMQESTQPTSLEILTCSTGEAMLNYQGQDYSLGQAESIVLPASLGAYELKGKAEVLRCYIPS